MLASFPGLPGPAFILYSNCREKKKILHSYKTRPAVGRPEFEYCIDHLFLHYIFAFERGMCVCPGVIMVPILVRFRYTLDELRGMLEVVQERADGYQDWSSRVETVLDGPLPQKAGVCVHC